MTWKYVNRTLAFPVVLRRIKFKGEHISVTEFNILATLNTRSTGWNTTKLMIMLNRFGRSTNGVRLKKTLENLLQRGLVTKTGFGYRLTGDGLYVLRQIERKIRLIKFWRLKKFKV